MSIVIGLCGFAGSGKTTAAEYFVHEHGFVRLSFAAAVKDVTSVLFGWDRTQLDGRTPTDRAWREQPDAFWSLRLNQPWTPRRALQYVGTDLCREHIHPNIWADQVAAQIHRMGPDAKVVIDDVRFVNEINTLQTLGSHILSVHRQQPDGSWFPSPEHAQLWATAPSITPQTPLHQSEWEWLTFPDIHSFDRIFNDGTPEGLAHALKLWYTTHSLSLSVPEAEHDE